ncbi:D-alanyl-D-alanine carboxypeptidase family protein [Alicyclobacillus cycloheptanicus]|uniref:D-alanyl-D-alanine carboxypeptidase (Penicillin-binding protein 5/6) n=1 Tax=Alicyclobacillus cycloheptanicus TaxID=1457 RepID=A0ABT9XE95_9BACL|nr:serine hydrolase [Alicyclobacillus cycloheptanicus]MDQ0188616.1 D-alanyl-D-alanine carboxypeptidase (penicillin-binding protein 5/6) [Alicyclobacillus cycloheptanicus]
MRGRIITAVVVIVIIALGVIQLVRPVAAAKLQQTVPASAKVQGTPVAIQWPKQGQAALAVSGVGLIGNVGPQTPVPIASVTKIMTAYLVLKAHPLAEGQDGPTLTITADDVRQYEQDKAAGQSVVQVQAGEKLTERELLEALLLPSANNAADLLAAWTAGSKQAFVAEMNQTAKKLGMNHTHYADASGVNPATVSTAVDQLKIAEKAMAIPAFRETVAMKQASLPVAGVQYNVDYALGKSGIIGVKTGSTDEAGGCFVFATEHTVAGKPALVLGVVLGQQGNNSSNSELMTALTEGESLSLQSGKILQAVSPVKAGQTVGMIDTGWQAPVPVVVSKSANLVAWQGMPVTMKLLQKPNLTQVAAGEQVGTLEIRAGQQVVNLPVRAAHAIQRPSLVWRLERVPFMHR